MRHYNFPVRVNNNYTHIRVNLDSLEHEYTISIYKDGKILRHVGFTCVDEFPEDEQKKRIEAAFLVLKPQLIEFFEGKVSFDVPSRTAANL